MELLIIGLVAGGVLGAKGKNIVKAAAKSYMAVAEKTRELTANVREDFRDAVEEARYEHEQKQLAAEEEDVEGADAAAAATTNGHEASAPAAEERTVAKRRTRTAAEDHAA